MMGSVAYGASGDTSDIDVYGWCIPPKKYLYPHTTGYIYGFDDFPSFNQFTKHGLQVGGKKEYDFTIYSIVKYLKLCSECNPNMIDSLFVPRRCVLHSTPIGEMVRDRRQIFLHKGSVYKFTGYMHSQISKLDREPEGKRKATVEKFGWDVKFGYHAVRLACELEMILEEQDIELDRHREMYKAIRRGEWTVEHTKDWVQQKEKHLQDLRNKSKLPERPNMVEIKQLLLDCLEQHYGSIGEEEVAVVNKADQVLAKICELVEEYK
jgi:predicted nucleotidyltransferase